MSDLPLFILTALGVAQTGILTGIFFRLGSHSARLDNLEKA